MIVDCHSVGCKCLLVFWVPGNICLGILPFGMILCYFGCWANDGKSLLLVVMGLLLTVQVHDSAVGKNCKVLSGFLVLNSLVFLRKVGQLQFQLV